MKNITITLSHELAQWAKIMAARNQKSLSKFITSVLEAIKESNGDDDVLNQFLAFKPRTMTKRFKREELYDRIS